MLHFTTNSKSFSQNRPLSSKHKNSRDRVPSNFRFREAYLTPGRSYLDSMDGIHKGKVMHVKPDFKSGLVPGYVKKNHGYKEELLKQTVKTNPQAESALCEEIHPPSQPLVHEKYVKQGCEQDLASLESVIADINRTVESLKNIVKIVP